MFGYGERKTVEQITKLRCNKCGFTVKLDKQRLVGCGCDPDASSWIALEKTGRLLKMSDANYDVLETHA